MRSCIALQHQELRDWAFDSSEAAGLHHDGLPW